jgi:hypothetical protein
MSDGGAFPAVASAPGVQAIDLDLQNLVKAVNRLAELLKPTPQVVTGSRASGAALQSLLTALAASGLIVDNTTA